MKHYLGIGLAPGSPSSLVNIWELEPLCEVKCSTGGLPAAESTHTGAVTVRAISKRSQGRMRRREGLNTKYCTCLVFGAQSLFAFLPFLSTDSLALNFSFSKWIIMFYYQLFRAKKDQQALNIVSLVMVSWFSIRSGKTNAAWGHGIHNYSWMKSKKSMITSKREASEINSQTKDPVEILDVF